MKGIWLIFLNLIFLFQIHEIAASTSETSENVEDKHISDIVMNITNINFEEMVVNSPTPWLLICYAPWCGHCVKMMPLWKKLATALAETETTTKIGKVDCTASRKTCSRFSVGSYPTIVFVNEGQIYPYNDPRTLESIKEFALDGWKKVESTGKIPDISYGSLIFDTILEFATENMVLSTFIGIGVIALFVAGLVSLLDRYMGEDEDDEYESYNDIKPKTE